MSFELRLLVPAAKSMRSMSATARPRSAASRAIPAPVMPPPTTSRSSRSAGSRASVASRVSGESGGAIGRARSALGVELGQGGLRLGHLVGAALFARDLQRAARERQRLLAVATGLARLGEHQPRLDGVRVLVQHVPQQALGPLRT